MLGLLLSFLPLSAAAVILKARKPLPRCHSCSQAYNYNTVGQVPYLRYVSRRVIQQPHGPHCQVPLQAHVLRARRGSLQQPSSHNELLEFYDSPWRKLPRCMEDKCHSAVDPYKSSACLLPALSCTSTPCTTCHPQQMCAREPCSKMAVRSTRQGSTRQVQVDM